jgi:hypothetical protein
MRSRYVLYDYNNYKELIILHIEKIQMREQNATHTIRDIL